MQPEIRHFSDLEALSRSAAGLVQESAESSIREKNLFSLVLSGGSTPRRLYQLLAEARLPWDRTHLFWGDERCVPPDHPYSNFRMAHETLISKVPVPPGQIQRIPAEKGPAAADEYQQTLTRFFEERHPLFDLVLLGLGADGHTASLFTGDPAIEETTRLVTYVSQTPHSRITLTLPALNRGRRAAFLVSGNSKREAAERILSEPNVKAGSGPAVRVQPQERLLWFLSID